MIAVTGGRGFIGQAVITQLENAGIEAKSLDLPDGDITNPSAIDRAIAGCDGVIHLAGVLGTHELFDRPHFAVDVNVHGTLNVLEACVHHQARYVGITMPQVFPSVYTATKTAATRLASAFHHTYQLPVSHVRAFNAYGPGQHHGHGHPQKIIPTFAVEAWSNRPIPIWGDGLQTVDLIHVDDLAHMLVDALGHGDDVTFDGGTGLALTVNEVAEAVTEHTYSTAGLRHLPMRRGELPTEIVATGEGWDRLDWRPTHNWGRLRDTLDAYKAWQP